MMTQEAIIGEVRKMLSQRLRVAPERVAALEPDSPLLRGGLGLDSLDCIELLLGLEDEFGLQFSEDADEGWIEHFSSLEKISQLVIHMKAELPGERLR
ncbi:MAG: acyl carrier protein [Deltaproteobacteria bacterium]|nr:acyl carrier protein [Deltaproteobacteria bacterium]